MNKLRFGLLLLVLLIMSVGIYVYLRDKKPVELSVAQKPVCEVSSEGIIAEISTLKGSQLVENQTLVDFASHRVPETISDFSHDGFLNDNRQYFEFPVGETLAKNYCSDKEVVAAWLASPTHKEVMLDERFDHIGISQGVNKMGSIYVVAIFGDIN